MKITHGPRWLLVVLLTVLALVPRTGRPVAAARAADNTARYRVTDLGTLGGSSSGPINVGERGQVVGVSALVGDNTVGAFLWQDGRMTALASLGGPQSGASAINARGQISGWANTTTAAAPSIFDTTSEFCNPPAPGVPAVTCHAVLWTEGVVRDLGTLGGPNSTGENNGINDRGQVIGASETTMVDPTSSTGAPQYHAFLWQRGAMRDLGTLGGPDSYAAGLNERGQVVGASAINAVPTAAPHGFVWQQGAMSDLGTLGGTFSLASAINNRGQIVGFASLSGDTAAHAFVWDHGAMTDLGTLPGDVFSQAFNLVDSGEVLGTSVAATGVSRAVVWDKGTVTDLNTLISPTSGWQLIDAMSGNERGLIVGDGLHNGQPHAYLLTPRGDERSAATGTTAPPSAGAVVPAQSTGVFAAQETAAVAALPGTVRALLRWTRAGQAWGVHPLP